MRELIPPHKRTVELTLEIFIAFLHCKYDLTKTNKYSIFNSGDFIPKSRKYECTNGAQTLVVWAFSNFVENLRTTISKKSIIIL